MRSDTLPGVTRPDLSSRIERTEEEFSAISDTVLEIKDVVDQHTDTLAAHGRELAAIKQTLTQHGKMLTEILRRLDAR